jgi:pimeloyl-ACP methyl ester carboxylesterase
MQTFLTYDQLHRSWYMYLFQHPLAEMAVSMDDLAFLDHLWADWSPGYDAATDTAQVKDCLRDPANLAAALGYYRALLGDGPRDPRYDEAQAAATVPTPQPTLYLHGVDDGCLGADMVATAADHLPAEGSRVELIEHAGHFLHLEQPAIVNQLVVDFVTA